jgi:hypothetical protein
MAEKVLDQVPLVGAIVTGDALYAQRALCQKKEEVHDALAQIDTNVDRDWNCIGHFDVL